MSYNNANNTGGSTAMRVVVATCFVILCWLWVYCFQADSLAVQQHLLSNGQTAYERHVGAVIITFVLLLAQQIIYGLVSRVMSRMGVPATEVFLSRQLWVHLLVAFAFLLTVVFVSGTNAVNHYTDRVEMRLMEGRADKALLVGNESMESSPRLTMLRAYALARQGKLGDGFFRYAVSGNGADLLPGCYSPADMLHASRQLMSDSHTWANIFPTDSIFRLLGAMPKGRFTTSRFLQLLCQKDSVSRGQHLVPLPRAAYDYRLTMLLTDRRLEDFARLLPCYYKLDDTLPQHYREALILYQHRTAHPHVVYRHSVTDTDFADYQALRRQYASKSECRVHRLENFFGTYWYYYDYR